MYQLLIHQPRNPLAISYKLKVLAKISASLNIRTPYSHSFGNCLKIGYFLPFNYSSIYSSQKCSFQNFSFLFNWEWQSFPWSLVFIYFLLVKIAFFFQDEPVCANSHLQSCEPTDWAITGSFFIRIPTMTSYLYQR